MKAKFKTVLFYWTQFKVQLLVQTLEDHEKTASKLELGA